MQSPSLTHARAVFLMVLVTLLWSIAGVVTRHLDAARSFEVTFWRSFFNALALTVALSTIRGASVWRNILHSTRVVWISGVCWAVMFTAFMLALTRTTVANVLVTMAVSPLITALFARVLLRHKLPRRTWAAIVAAGLGIAWMYGQQAATDASLIGTLVALLVPLAAAINFTTLQYAGDHQRAAAGTPAPDMLPAVVIGAAISALVTLPLAYPLRASVHDLELLALLGIVQLAVPCLLLVRLSRQLPAPEIALLGLLEVVFGVTWAWLGAGEQPRLRAR
jgi:drug/metabolite transporter (DMT)-like permease